MTAQGGDILAWLNAAISTREQSAQEAARAYGPRWVRPVDTDMVRMSDEVWFQVLSDEIAEHVVYNSPELVLRRCAADRKLLELHRQDAGCCTVCTGEETFDDDSDGNREFSRPAMPFPCDTVLALAEGYGWTEGKR